MSIINEALKKAQQIRKNSKSNRADTAPTPEAQAESKPDPKKPRVIDKAQFLFTWKMASLLTVAALLIVMLFANQQRVMSYTHTYAQKATNPSIHHKIKIAFEGVMLSDDARIALINKQSMHVGDAINGMRIIAINLDSIDLQSENGAIELKSGATYLL